jgi:Uma2 family endonuclease
MATVITTPAATEPAPYRFTAEQYHQMGESGIFKPDDRVELIEGEIIAMSPVGGPHANCVDALTRLFAPLADTHARLRVQNAVRLSESSEVQPDISIVTERVYGNDLPGVADVLLLIEVADSTYVTDRDVKVPLYAQSGIPQTILIDVRNRHLWHFSEPREYGYQVVRRYGSGDQVTIAMTSTLSITIRIDDLFAA